MKIGDFITGVALMVFMLSLFNIEGMLNGSIGTFAAMLVSGAWLVGYGWYTEEKKREGEW